MTRSSDFKQLSIAQSRVRLTAHRRAFFLAAGLIRSVSPPLLPIRPTVAGTSALSRCRSASLIQLATRRIVQRGIARSLHLDQEYLTFAEATKGRPVMEAALALAEQWPVPMANMWNAGYEPLAQRGAERGCSVILTGMGGDEWLTVARISQPIS